MTRLLRWLLLAAVLAAGALGGFAWWWLQQPLPMQPDSVQISVPPGTSPRGVADKLVQAGVQTSPQWLWLYFKFSGLAPQLRAGTYSIERGTTPPQLLERLVRGDSLLEVVRIVEGWTFRQMRDALAAAPHLKPTTKDMTDAQIMGALGLPGVPAEGRFFPDTYHYGRGTSDLVVLRAAQQALQKKLEAAWSQRASDLPLKSMDEALILASIVEKETGVEADRTKVAAVFNNRLRLGMLLQTDPTVIYGLGDKFDGNLRKRDLESDTPYNTYTRKGLPPTPIALPGANSIKAAVQPEPSKALYFVARGDGSSVFSESLAEHNRAVNRFQRGIR